MFPASRSPRVLLTPLWLWLRPEHRLGYLRVALSGACALTPPLALAIAFAFALDIARYIDTAPAPAPACNRDACIVVAMDHCIALALVFAIVIAISPTIVLNAVADHCHNIDDCVVILV